MKTQKKIVLASAIIAIGGFLSELSAFAESMPKFPHLFIITCLNFLRTINLSFFNIQLLSYYNFDTNIYCNYLNLLFYFLMALGVLFYSRSCQRETRLLRFAFSIILLCNVIFIVDSIINIFSGFLSITFGSITGWLLWILHASKTLGVAYLSWWILHEFERTRELERVTEKEKVIFVKASKLKRAFNFGIDTLICVLIFSIYTRVYGVELWQKLDANLGQQVTMFVLLLLFRILYYPFFETLFGTTPAKFLTETRAITLQGDKLTFSHSLSRTFSRFVPFETFSFLVDEGWHDRWTLTQVVKEQRKGVSGTWYFWIVPAMLILGAVSYLGYEEYKQYQQYLVAKQEYEQKIQAMEQDLSNISTAYYIKLKEAKSYSSKRIYLKIEDVAKEKLFASVVPIEEYDVTMVGADKYYTQYQLVLDKIELNKGDLLNALTKEYSQYQAEKRNTLKLPGYETDYEVETLIKQYAPMINGSGGSVYRGNLELYFENCGWGAKITNIRNIEGAIQWMLPQPYLINGLEAKQYGCPTFSLIGSNYEPNSLYKFELEVEDASGSTHTYLVEGINLKREIIKIKERVQ